MIGVLAVYVVLDIQDYNWLAEEQGSKMLESLYVNTEQKIDSFINRTRTCK